MKTPSAIEELSAAPLNAAMNRPFAIATGSKSEVRNVIVRVLLRDGTVGYGEGAPSIKEGDEQAEVLKEIRKAAQSFVGRALLAPRDFLGLVDERFDLDRSVARAAVGMALLDAWTRQKRVPLRSVFGNRQSRVKTDVTVTVVPAAQAYQEALTILRFGVRTVKIKIGTTLDKDLARVLAVCEAAKKLGLRTPRLILDANQGFNADRSLAFLTALKKRGVKPALFEQPVAREDLDGLGKVQRFGGVPVAADESVKSRGDAAIIARRGLARVINIKLMKSGLLEAWDIAKICRKSGLGLMIGGMIESRLAMVCGAHFAAGFGGFDFIDLDTPLWFKKDPMSGVRLARGGIYDLSKVKAGIGVAPKVR
jgi:L-alanine-DL-glutamate epimerase-like enolase superfamily enzyme